MTEAIIDFIHQNTFGLFFGFFGVTFLWGFVWGLIDRRTVSQEPAVVVSKGRVQRKTVSLDVAKERAVALLVRDGWKRTAAVSALESIGWSGYPDADKMMLAAWQSMPSYR